MTLTLDAAGAFLHVLDRILCRHDKSLLENIFDPIADALSCYYAKVVVDPPDQAALAVRDYIDQQSVQLSKARAIFPNDLDDKDNVFYLASRIMAADVGQAKHLLLIEAFQLNLARGFINLNLVQHIPVMAEMLGVALV